MLYISPKWTCLFSKLILKITDNHLTGTRRVDIDLLPWKNKSLSSPSRWPYFQFYAAFFTFIVYENG